MKRFQKHHVKVEKPEASTSHSRTADDYDLTYYIHDRVELMHQVFSLLKHKDLKSMAPECVRHISVDDLQELCTEELLGISSKRLCAILDGAEPPSDTESSSESPERFETISLDSISSDEEILSETSSRKSKKHKRNRHNSKTKTKKKKNKQVVEDENAADADKSRASRAGLTVLELLELQARARAIRAQLQQEQAAKQAAEPVAATSHHSSDNEVEIKEEPAEVVEISSEDEKPNIQDLNEKTSPKPKSKEPATEPEPEETNSVTKRINNLVITVPQVKKSRKIKLNRTKSAVSVANKETNDNTVAESPKTSNDANKTQNTTQSKLKEVTSKEKEAKTKEKQSKSKEKVVKSKEKVVKSKEKKKKQKKVLPNQDSDHDEITLQLSDTEKMDLLEDLDRKHFDKLSSSDSEDSESSSSDSESQESDKEPDKASPEKQNNKDIIIRKEDIKETDDCKDILNTDKDSTDDVIKTNDSDKTQNIDEEVTLENSNETEVKSPDKISQETVLILEDSVESEKSQNPDDNTDPVDIDNSNKIIEEHTNTSDSNIEITSVEDIPVVESEQEKKSVSVCSSPKKETEMTQDSPKVVAKDNSQSPKLVPEKEDSSSKDSDSGSQSPVIDAQPRQNSTDKISDAQTSRITISIGNSLASSDQIEGIKKRIVHIENIGSQEVNIDSQDANDKDNMSDGELSDEESSEIEAVELKSEVVCISDDETVKKSQKKKKKKEKKSKSKKSKKSKQDFRKDGDQNFFTKEHKTEELHLEEVQDAEESIDEVIKVEEEDLQDAVDSPVDEVIKIEEELIYLEDDDYDDVYEILELSDDSSCYEVEGAVLSKEPTAQEIEALSAKIDEIEREDVVTEEEIREHEQRNAKDNEEIENLENISWKDRYLDSKKVKKVLSTSSIFNALRKKNRELKKKLEESKNKEEALQEENKVAQVEKEEIAENVPPIEEGSIEQYNTLHGSTKYVDPVPEIIEKTDAAVDNIAESEKSENGEVVNNVEMVNNEPIIETPAVGKELRKDAKQLLKMYKRLLKYNDMNKQKNKQKDPNKKKKKKSKKKNSDAITT